MRHRIGLNGDACSVRWCMPVSYTHLEKGCEVYRLYSDNTEGLCVDAKEIADHAAKGGICLLYTSLQREANRYYGFTAQQTLDLVQTLYEKKLLTYPRTDSQFITDDMEMCIRDSRQTDRFRQSPSQTGGCLPCTASGAL